MEDKIYMIDATSPFFSMSPDTLTNWSKIPYQHLEVNGDINPATYRKIKTKFEKYIEIVS